MVAPRRAADDLLEVVRALLLLQGAILVATTVEALFWRAAFGATGPSVFLSGAAAATVLVARARLRADRSWTRRIVYAVEGLTLAVLALDTVLAIAIADALPLPVALLTRLLLPMSVIALLHRAARAPAAPATSTVAAVEMAS